MSDYSELKRLAEAAQRGWPDMVREFIAAASPAVILAILAELDALREMHRKLLEFREALK